MRIGGAFLTTAVFFVSLVSCALAKDDPSLDQPPAGIVPATATLEQILAAHDKVARPAKTGARDTVIEDWSFVDTGLHGTEHLERSGTDYHSRIVTYAGTEEYGQLNNKRWHKDANGYTSPTSDVEDTSFFAIRVLEDAADPKNDVTVLGQTSDPKPAYVLQVKRPGYKHPEWIFYDVATGNIVRREYIQGKHRIISTFDDFRSVDGVTQAWHVHDAWWDSAWDDDWNITAFHAGMPIATARFAPPPSDPPQAELTSRQYLPAQFIDNAIVLRLNIGDRGLDFELDSSQPTSMVDRELAQELNLPTYGAATRLTNGDPIAYGTTLPDSDIGPIHLHNFHVKVEDIAYKPSYSTKVVGVLGYDFLAANVIHIDYVNQRIEAIPAKLFTADKPVPDALDLPFQLDDGVPLVPVQIGSTFTDHVIVNCDMPLTVVFGSFADAHADELQDMDPGHHRQEFVPFADEGSFGVSAEVWFSRAASLRFANANYEQIPLLTTNVPYNLSGTQDDAMLGLDYLRFFDLYFDYPHNRFLVAPNKWFYALFKKST